MSHGLDGVLECYPFLRGVPPEILRSLDVDELLLPTSTILETKQRLESTVNAWINLSMQTTTAVLVAAALQNPRRRQLIREGPLAPSPGGRTICQKRREFRCLREAVRIP